MDVDDDKWNYFIMYEKYLNENQEYAYGVVAFGTVYEYYAYPSHIRPRISQLLVLPPFQKKGLAAYLINSMYKHYIDMQSVVDITGKLIFGWVWDQSTDLDSFCIFFFFLRAQLRILRRTVKRFGISSICVDARN